MDAEGENVLNKQEINWKIDALDRVDKSDSHRCTHTPYSIHMENLRMMMEEITRKMLLHLSRESEIVVSHFTYRSGKSALSIIHSENCST